MENIKYKVIAAEDIDYEENTFDAITACQCFWYFDSKIVVPKIKRILRPGGIFLKVYMSYMKEEDITQDSNEIVKQINNSWEGASPSIQDLKTHYFENPQMDTIIVDIPFTRESWHGRMLASRGVMAAMNEKQISEFGKRHMDMLCKKYPKQFTVKHKVFLTWYTMK
jgi:methyltransferase type 11